MERRIAFSARVAKLAAMPDSAEPSALKDRTTFRVRSLDAVDEDAERVAYWLSRPAEERLAAIETLRRAWYGENYTSAGLPGVLVITHQT
jgi:hypothetical protein